METQFIFFSSIFGCVCVHMIIPCGSIKPIVQVVRLLIVVRVLFKSKKFSFLKSEVFSTRVISSSPRFQSIS